MSLYEQILEKSKTVDEFWENKKDDFEHIEINLRNYTSKVFKSFDPESFPENSFFILDKNLNLKINKEFTEFSASESETKNVEFIDKFVSANSEKLKNKILVVVGGGVILDTSLCIAEKLKLKIIFVPTTVLSMSDSSIGGKARANKVENGNFLKHFYKSYYEPQEIVICENFLESLGEQTVLFGLAEIIKHAFFQSEKLLAYLLSDDFQPFTNKQSLLKAILWKVDLHRICLEVDPKESEEGSKKIIREAHNFSDKLEKETGFKVSHGEAVLRGIKFDLENSGDQSRILKFQNLCQKLKLNL